MGYDADALAEYMPTALIVKLGEIIEQDADVGVSRTFYRALVPTDPTDVASVVMAKWTPGAESLGRGPCGTNLYTLMIGLMHKNSDEMKGLVISQEVAVALRVLLYSSTDVFQPLAAVGTGAPAGPQERFQMLRVVGQEYASVKLSGHYAFISQTEITIETERTG